MPALTRSFTLPERRPYIPAAPPDALLLIDLPTEIIEHIFTYLNYFELKTCQRVCAKFDSITGLKSFDQALFRKCQDSQIDVAYLEISSRPRRSDSPSVVDRLELKAHPVFNNFFYEKDHATMCRIRLISHRLRDRNYALSPTGVLGEFATMPPLNVLVVELQTYERYGQKIVEDKDGIKVKDVFEALGVLERKAQDRGRRERAGRERSRTRAEKMEIQGGKVMGLFLSLSSVMVFDYFALFNEADELAALEQSELMVDGEDEISDGDVSGDNEATEQESDDEVDEDVMVCFMNVDFDRGRIKRKKEEDGDMEKDEEDSGEETDGGDSSMDYSETVEPVAGDDGDVEMEDANSELAQRASIT